jgi:hypothetical protein
MAQSAKAYILKINDPVSNDCAKVCSDSCDRVGLDWEYHRGYQNMTGKMAWTLTGLRTQYQEPVRYVPKPAPQHKANACSAGHGAIWKRIAEGNEDVGILLEHDAIMLHYPSIEIPDGYIVTLGYKLKEPARYDHEAAGPPTELIDIDGHEGAHAYAMTRKTAQFLCLEIARRGVLGCVDNAYFIRGQRQTQVPLKIASPTPAMGWLRDSTIWSGGHSSVMNYEFISSFAKNYK